MLNNNIILAGIRQEAEGPGASVAALARQRGRSHRSSCKGSPQSTAWMGKDRLTRALNLKDLQVAHGKGEPALVQSIEGAHFLEGHLERVEEVFKRGIRHLQLLHDKGP